MSSISLPREITGLPDPQLATHAVGIPATPREILNPSFSRMAVRYLVVSNSWKPSSPKLNTLSTMTCACFFMPSIWPARSAFMAASFSGVTFGCPRRASAARAMSTTVFRIGDSVPNAAAGRARRRINPGVAEERPHEWGRGRHECLRHGLFAGRGGGQGAGSVRRGLTGAGLGPGLFDFPIAYGTRAEERMVPFSAPRVDITNTSEINVAPYLARKVVAALAATGSASR